MSNVLGLVSFRVFPTHMGGQKGVALFYKYLRQHHNVLLAVSKDNQETDLIKTEKLLLPNKKIYLNFLKIKEIKKLIKAREIDVIIAEHSYAGWLGWLLHKSTGKPFIVHSHNIEYKRFRQMHIWWWKLYQWYEAWIHRKALYNFFISEEDRMFAINHFNLPEEKCCVVTYGVERKPFYSNRILLRQKLGLQEDKTILLFNGTLDYQPNYKAVEVLVDTIEPLLRRRLSNYEIVITGNRAPFKLINKMLKGQNLSYLGYIREVDLYYQAADIFINPVRNDTGVKTKLIESIANNCAAVSTESGASGIKKEVCGSKLVTVKDNDWNSFVDLVVDRLNQKQISTPTEFYDFYSWKTICKTASDKIQELAI